MAQGIAGIGIGGNSTLIRREMLDTLKNTLKVCQDVATQDKTDTQLDQLSKLFANMKEGDVSDQQLMQLSRVANQLLGTLTEGVQSGEFDNHLLKLMEKLGADQREDDVRKKNPAQTGFLTMTSRWSPSKSPSVDSISPAGQTQGFLTSPRETAATDSDVIKKAKRILAGGVESLSELRELMDMVGNDEMGVDILNAIQSAVEDFVRDQAGHCKTPKEFEEFASVITEITNGVKQGSFDFLSIVQDALMDVAGEVAANLNISKDQVVGIIYGAVAPNVATTDAATQATKQAGEVPPLFLEDTQRDAKTLPQLLGVFPVSTGSGLETASAQGVEESSNDFFGYSGKRFVDNFYRNLKEDSQGQLEGLMDVLQELACARAQTAINDIHLD